MLLLDTQIALWWLRDDRQLKKSIIDQLEASPCVISVVSAWEVSIKYRVGKLDMMPAEFVRGMKHTGAEILPLTEQHAMTFGRMANEHQDPFDVMLLTVAELESARFVTADKKLAAYAERHTNAQVIRA